MFIIINYICQSIIRPKDHGLVFRRTSVAFLLYNIYNSNCDNMEQHEIGFTDTKIRVNQTFTAQDMLGQEYEGMEFRNCVFASLRGVDLISCRFVNCDLSNIDVMNSGMQDVIFLDCKIIGVNFFEANDFGFSVDFIDSVVDFCGFENMKMNKSTFSGCRIHGTSFRGADLSKAKMNKCDLLSTEFSATNISGLDFTSCTNITMDLSLNKVKKTKFSPASLGGLLSHFDIIIQEAK